MAKRIEQRVDEKRAGRTREFDFEASRQRISNYVRLLAGANRKHPFTVSNYLKSLRGALNTCKKHVGEVPLSEDQIRIIRMAEEKVKKSSIRNILRGIKEAREMYKKERENVVQYRLYFSRNYLSISFGEEFLKSFEPYKRALIVFTATFCRVTEKRALTVARRGDLREAKRLLDLIQEVLDWMIHDVDGEYLQELYSIH